MTVALGLIAPAILVAALLARNPVPDGLIPGGEEATPTEGTRLVTSLDDGGRISAVLYELEASPSGLAVALSMDVDRGRPEWLAYWTPDEQTGGRLPDRAWLLGALGDDGEDRYPLPAPAARARGRIIVYRPLDAEVVADLRLP